MNVTIVGPDLRKPGGVSNFLQLLLGQFERMPCIDTRYLTVGGGSNRRFPMYLVEDQWGARKDLSLKWADLVHINPSLGYKSFLRDALIIRSAKKYNLKVLVFIHGWSWGMARYIDGPLRRLFDSSFGQADAFVVLADDFEKRLRRWGVTKPIYRGVTMVPDESIDVEAVAGKLDRLRKEETIAPVKVLFMSRLELTKGVMECITAVQRLAERSFPIALTIAGHGPAADDIEQYLRRTPILRRCITMAGYVSGSAKYDLVNSHHVFCLPTSYGEGLPTVVVEAMAFGLPVITSPVGGLADIFESGKMGYLVAPKDVDALTDALERLAESPALIADMGQYNFNYARDNFYVSKVSAKIENIYKSTVGSL